MKAEGWCVFFFSLQVSSPLTPASSPPPPPRAALVEACFLSSALLFLQLQFAVMRLSLEARGIDCKEDCKVELPWESLSRSSPCYQKAALCLWKQTRFQELLQESQFQVNTPQWLGFFEPDSALRVSMAV